MSKKPVQPHEIPTTGHSWDGIEEFDNPMPRWWLWTFYLCIIWGIGYTIAFPAWPLVSGATAGLLGWSTRGDVAADIAAVDEANGPINARLEAADMTALTSDPELHGYAVSAGAAVFKTWCAQCHGSGAAGAVGYPNLLDDDWLWGGTIEDIQTTVAHGIRNEEDDDARYSQMPAFGRDELLEQTEIAAIANYVVSLSGEPQDASVVANGAVLFEENCASCHGENAEGDIYQGAPNLADAIWLYGGSYADVVETISNARFGVMPAWSGRLSEAEIRSVTAYVHQLGGGE
ncbi:cytochrome-c oxidase, cbb3-type subunit III [Epibacterium sp. SM1979]|uniref:Cbb3-type cytochrome c oxidase subunit n=1 Tax=Tritonibacter litoralis TaxID=2662264 RepID=A0A843YH73_9RHOB|nr:cytochrome-c oxidase, cbb3-type subunit III [Tritonibacter litoralis]MQQ09178.1 cytochrome-c oxidase, cbb3-type subunit III [Tritonibacter litoralis]